MAFSGPSFLLLPSHIWEKIFLYLGTSYGKEARLACRELYRLTEPMFLRIHTLGDMDWVGYRQFLLKKGKPIRGLSILDTASLLEFQDDGLSLCEVFPNLRSISYSEEEEIDYKDMLALCKECLDLQHLRHISLYTKDFDETYAVDGGYEDDDRSIEHTPLSAISPIMSKLESLYTTSFPLSLIKAINESQTMKKLTIVTNCSRPLFLKLRRLVPGKEVQLYNDYGPVISSTDETGTWLFSSYGKIYFYWKAPDHVKIQETKWVKRVFPNFFCVNADNGYPILGRIMKNITMDHCTVISTDVSDYTKRTLHHLSNTLSIEIVCYGPTGIKYDENVKYVAKRLSLDINDEVDEVFDWVLRNFSHLQDFYIFKTFSDKVLPFKHPLPRLKSFYSSAPQSDEFWKQLIRNAPRLESLYINNIPGCFPLLRAERPTLQLFIFEFMFDGSRTIEEFSGYYKCLNQ